MISDLEIKGGADEFEAAVIAVVIDRISREEMAARQGRGGGEPALSAWVRALAPEKPGVPREHTWPA